MSSTSHQTEGASALICDKGHIHPQPLGGCALLIVRKDSEGTGYDILARQVLSTGPEREDPDRPGRTFRNVAYCIPNVIRQCGETIEDCALRAAHHEAGFESDRLRLHSNSIFSIKKANTEITMLIAKPVPSARSQVGDPDEDFFWTSTQYLEFLDIFPSFRVAGRRVREAIDIWDERRKAEKNQTSVGGRLKRTISNAAALLFGGGP